MASFATRVEVNPRINVDRTKFPFMLPAFREFKRLPLDPDVTFFVGDNGSGKSTLLEAIAVHLGFPAEGGRKAHNFATFDSHSNLHELILVPRTDTPKSGFFLRAESFYNVSTYVYKSTNDEENGKYHPPSPLSELHSMSHGEGFLRAISTFDKSGLFLLDEPESALSVPGQLQFLTRLNHLLGQNCQFIIATHSPIILGLGKGTIYEFSEGGIAPVAYEQTQPYQLTLDFLKNRGRYKELLGF